MVLAAKSPSSRTMSRLRAQQPLQERGVDDSSEPNFAIDRHNRDFGIVLGGQIGIAVDINLLDRKPETPLGVFQHVECLVAATTLRTCVDLDCKMLQARRANPVATRAKSSHSPLHRSGKLKSWSENSSRPHFSQRYRSSGLIVSPRSAISPKKKCHPALTPPTRIGICPRSRSATLQLGQFGV